MSKKNEGLVILLNDAKERLKMAVQSEKKYREALEDHFYDILKKLLPLPSHEKPKSFEPSEDFPVITLNAHVGPYTATVKVKSIVRIGEAWSEILIVTDNKYNSVIVGKEILTRCENLVELLNALEKAASNVSK